MLKLLALLAAAVSLAVPLLLLGDAVPSLPHTSWPALVSMLEMPAAVSAVGVLVSAVGAVGLWRAGLRFRLFVQTLAVLAILAGAFGLEMALTGPLRDDAQARLTVACLALATPIALLILTARLGTLDLVLLSAAAASGAGPWRRVTLVILPWIAGTALAAFVLDLATTGGQALLAAARLAPGQ